MSLQSTSAKEIELLEAVELKFALSTTDDAFQRLLATFLPAILLKLDSSHADTKQKVMSLLTHINKRLKASGGIQLPLNALMDTLQAQHGPLVKSMALVYMEMGVVRCGGDVNAVQLLPKLIQGIASKPLAQQQTLLQIILSLLPFYTRNAGQLDIKAIEAIKFDWQDEDAVWLLQQFGNVLLYTSQPTPAKPVKTSQTNQMSNPTMMATPWQPNTSTTPSTPTTDYLPPGLTIPVVALVTNNGKNLPSKITKLSILKFCWSDAFGVHDYVWPRFRTFLIASSSDVSEIASLGDDGIKKIGKPDLESLEPVQGLYSLYLSDSPPSPLLKQKILSTLSRSVKASNTLPQVVKVIFDALFVEVQPLVTGLKVKREGLLFLQWTIRIIQPKYLESLLPVLLSGLQKFIKDLPTDAPPLLLSEVESLKSTAYECIGSLAQRLPTKFSSETELLRQLFAALDSESNMGVKMGVRSALSGAMTAFSPPPTDIQDLLLETSISSNHLARYSAVQYANLYPFSDPVARYIDLICSDDSKLEVREIAKKGLELVKPLPKLSGMTQVVLQKKSWLIQRGKDQMTKEKTPLTGKCIDGMPLPMYAQLLELLRKLIIATAAGPEQVSTIDVEDFGLTSGIADPSTTTKVKDLLAQWWTTSVDSMQDDQDETAIKDYLALVSRALESKDADGPMHATAATCLLFLLSHSPSSVAETFSDNTHLQLITSFLPSLRQDSRTAMAHVLGIVATSNLESQELLTMMNSWIQGCMDTTKSTTLEARQGMALALGHVIGRLSYRYTPQQLTCLKSTLEEALNALLSLLSSDSTLLQSGACVAMAEAGRYAPLPFEKRRETAEALIQIAKKAKDVRLQELAVTSLAHVALGDVDQANVALDFFYTLGTEWSKQVEAQFTVGEAIAIVAGGWTCTSLLTHLDLADVKTNFPPVPDNVMIQVLDKLQEMVIKGGQAARKAVCIWLLCLVKLDSKHSVVQGKLKWFHDAFQSLLSDRDDLTQEVASKGIGLVYENGDEAVKKVLVNSLTGTLLEGKRQVGAGGNLTGDTQLFDQTLGQAPGGEGNISTYQSILSLAADMNQPDLVYRFMNLASANAIWSSRRGASLGMSTIIAAAQDELQPFLPTLVPKLYRWKFDPNPKVGEAMNSIWKALVKEPQKALDQHFDTLVSDLTVGMGDRLWRTRESSCLAMADLLHGRSIEQLEPHLQKIWEMCFRGLDDIKETVREAALTTCRVLTNITVKYCDPSMVSPQDGSKIMAIVMPFLLHKGLNNMAEDVRKFSLATILKLCKKAGVLLNPHVPDLVGVLMESLSNMEPQVMNYLSFHADKYNMSQDQLDTSRLNAAKMSPMMDAIESTVDQLDQENMKQLVSVVCNVARKGVGLPTKAGCARFVVTLCVRVPSLVRPYGDQLLRAMTNAMGDRNAAVRKSYAVAVGYLAGLCSEDALSKLLQHLKNLYLGNPDDEGRGVAGVAMHEISRHSSDTFRNRCLNVALPLSYFGSHDQDKDVAEPWKETWQDNTAGSSTALKLYQEELLALLTELFSSTSWAMKRQAATTLADMANTLGKDMAPMLDNILPLVLEACGGRTWDGKEAVLEALSTIATACREVMMKRSELDQVIKVLFREAKKQNKPYKMRAIQALGDVGEAFPGRVEWDQCKELLMDLAKNVDEDSDDAMDTDDRKKTQLGEKLRETTFKTLAQCFPRDGSEDDEFTKVLVEALSISTTWSLRLVVLQAVEIWLSKVKLTKLHGLDDALFANMQDWKYATVRESACKVLKTLAGKVQGQGWIDKLDECIKNEGQMNIKSLEMDLKASLK